MSGDVVEKEIEAIRAVLTALEPLSESARSSVLDYVLKRLGITLTAFSTPQGSVAPGQSGAGSPSAGPSPAGPVAGSHIEALKNEKKPRSANEMAALVAYYLANLALPDQRKNAINTQDVETYFKIAKFPLPKQIRVTLQNARNAGYLDSTGDGEYKLNAVGHNLVVHNMPRGAEHSSKRGRKGGQSRSARAKKRR